MNEPGEVQSGPVASVWMAEIGGLAATVGGSAAVVYALFYAGVVSQPAVVVLIALPCMAGASLWAWHVSEKGRLMDAGQWLGGMVVTPVLGAVSFAIDVFVGSMHGEYASFIEAALHAGGPFGVVLTALICPIGTLICLGGWVRTGLLARMCGRPAED